MSSKPVFVISKKSYTGIVVPKPEMTNNALFETKFKHSKIFNYITGSTFKKKLYK